MRKTAGWLEFFLEFLLWLEDRIPGLQWLHEEVLQLLEFCGLLTNEELFRPTIEYSLSMNALRRAGGLQS